MSGPPHVACCTLHVVFCVFYVHASGQPLSDRSSSQIRRRVSRGCAQTTYNMAHGMQSTTWHMAYNIQHGTFSPCRTGSIVRHSTLHCTTLQRRSARTALIRCAHVNDFVDKATLCCNHRIGELLYVPVNNQRSHAHTGGLSQWCSSTRPKHRSSTRSKHRRVGSTRLPPWQGPCRGR